MEKVGSSHEQKAVLICEERQWCISRKQIHTASAEGMVLTEIPQLATETQTGVPSSNRTQLLPSSGYLP